MSNTKMSQMLSVPLSRVRSPKLRRQTPVEDDIDGQQHQPPKSIASDYESNSSRSLSPYWRIVMDPESSSSYLDVPETSNNSRRSSNNSVVRFTPHDVSDLCSILDMTCESENLEKAIISNDKYTVRRIIDIHQNKFNLIKERSSFGHTQSGYPVHSLATTQPVTHPTASFGSPSITSNTDILEGISKQALASNDIEELPSVSTPEPTISIFDPSSNVLTFTTGPLSAALINCHHQNHLNGHVPSNSSPINLGSPTHDRFDNEHESMFTAPTSFHKESNYPASDSPNDAPPIFRNVLHVAIMYDARDVMRICLKYGIDPNAPGMHPNAINSPTHSQTPSSNTYSQSSTRLSPDLPRASPCRNGTLDYNTYYTNDRLFTLPPLFLAAQRNNHYACSLLLKYGANVNVRDEQHCSPLHLAARLQHDVCDILISHHACITIPNKYGDTPLTLWPTVKTLQIAFVEREFSKLCRKPSSFSKRYRFLHKDHNHDHYQTLSSMINFSNGNNSFNGLVPAHGLRNLRRVFRYSGSDSYDSKSFKKSLSSQSSIGKSKRFNGSHVPSTSVARSESRQMSEEVDEGEATQFGRSTQGKRKTGTSSLAVNILHGHKSTRHQHSGATTNHASAETNALNDRLLKRFSELSRLATNSECVDQLMDLLRMQNSIDEILALIKQTPSGQVHGRVAELLHTLFNTCYQEFLRNHDKREHVELFQVHTKKLLDISLELLSSDMVNMQYLALITINRLYDVYVYHNLINPGRYNACYIPASRRQLHLSLMISQNSTASSSSNPHEESNAKNINDRLPKTSTLSSILRKISRETDEKRAAAAAATGGGSGATPIHSKLSLHSTQQTSGPGPGGGVPSSNNSNSTGLTREASKRWIPLYSNDNLAPASSLSPSTAGMASSTQGLKSSTVDLTNSQPNSSKSNILTAENNDINSSAATFDCSSNTIFTYEPFSLLYQIEPLHLLRLMRTRLDAHRREFNNRPKCVPSTRSPLCTHHCVVILAARLLAILCQDHGFQERFLSTKENLVIIVDMLNINNDPHLICLILQTLGMIALNPDCHDVLTQADIPDTVLHLILPADEMFYTNQTTKFARYVKHLGARILVYMGLLTKVGNKVNLFDILDIEPEPLDCDKPQSFENNFVHHMAVGETVVGTLWTSFAGISIEKLLDELLKNGLNQRRSTSKDSQDNSQPPSNSPVATSTTMTNSNDSLLYNLSYLSSVIHPVIILRLLEHRLFTPLFKKKSMTSNPPMNNPPITNPPTNNPAPAADQKPVFTFMTPLSGASAIASIPTLPRPDQLKRQRCSLTTESILPNNERSPLIKPFTQSAYEKHRKGGKSSISNVSTTSNVSTASSVTSNQNNNTNTNGPATASVTGNTDLSIILSLAGPLASAISNSNVSNNSSNQSSTTQSSMTQSASMNLNPSSSRKWFWRSSEKNNPSTLPNDRNPLLQAIVENDTLASSNNLAANVTANSNSGGVGDMQLLEKELLNLPTFQLSDSQNPLLPSPTCLNDEFSTSFDQPTVSNNHNSTKRAHSSSSNSSNTKNGLVQINNNSNNNNHKSKFNDDDHPTTSSDYLCGGGLLATLNIPFVAVRTPSDEIHRSSSHSSSPSRYLSTSASTKRQQRSLSNTRMSVRETVRSLFRSSKTIDNMTSALSAHNPLNHGNRRDRRPSKSKMSSGLTSNQLSHSQPIVTETSLSENIYFESPVIGHSEQTPLIDRRKDSKYDDQLKTTFEDDQELNGKDNRFNRHALHLPLELDGLQRSRSCTDDITIPINNIETNPQNTTVTTHETINTISLPSNHNEVLSLHSSDSTTSCLSHCLPTQSGLTCQLSAPTKHGMNMKSDLSKSQESLFSLSSPIKSRNSFKSLIMGSNNKDPATKQSNDVLILIASWVSRSPEDFQDYLVQKELRSFFTLLESLRDSFRSWTSQIKEILGLQDVESPVGNEMDDVTTEDISREYIKMQRDIVSGRLICSKEEAANLAAVQLRLEAWPEENLDLAEEDELNALNLSLNDGSGNGMTATSVFSGFHSMNTSWRDRHRRNLIKFRLTDIPCCKRVDSTMHKSKKPFLPPDFRHSNEILKLIKDKQRKLFHINDYDNPTRLKECYVRLCRNLASYNAEIYVVKEIHPKRAKRKGTRLLCIRSDKIFLLDMKTRTIYKEQRIADLEHWITSGHHLSAGTNDLVLEFRSKTKWRLQLNSTTDLRAITVYLWKIVNIEGFANLDQHIPLSLPMRRHSQMHNITRRMTFLPASLTPSSSVKNPYQTIADLYKKPSTTPRENDSTASGPIDHIQSVTKLIQNTRTSTLNGSFLNSSYIQPSDHTQLLNFSADLEELKYLFDFPEEVAIRLTDTEHELFLSIPPLQYLRHLTLDMPSLLNTDTSMQGKCVRILVQRFQAVGSFIQQLIVSQTSFQERKAIVASIVRCAITCWYMGNFNSAMQILAGLKIEAFRPLWATIGDEIPGFKFLTDAFNSNEKTPQYCDAVSRALDIPTCKVVPFFGTFLKDMRAILNNVPSIAVLCNRNTQKPIEAVTDAQNQEHFLTRIGVGGLINTRKVELIHMVLKDIAIFHNRFRRQPFFKCCDDLNRVRLMTPMVVSETKDKHSATVCASLVDDQIDRYLKPKYNRHQSFPCTSISNSDYDSRRVTNIAIQVIGDNGKASSNENEITTVNNSSIFPYRSTLDPDEPETYYCLNVSFYQPIFQPKHNHEVSLLSMHHIIDFNHLQMLRNGTTLILYEEDTMHTCLVTVRLELDNCTLTWTKPFWDTHRSIENVSTANQVSSEAAHYSILMKRYILRDVAFVDMDEGFLQLKYVKHVRSGILHCDLLPIIKRYKLNDISNPENCFTIVYGASISENKTLCFISPKYCSQIWHSSIDKLVTQYRKHRLCSDRRIVWLKNQYLSLYHENERFQGPTPMNAVLVFGGRQWNSSSLFSYERDHPSSKKSSSVMKPWTSLGLRRRNKYEQDRKASFSTESDPTNVSKWYQHNSALAVRGKSKTLDYKTKVNPVSQSVKSPRLFTNNQAATKNRYGLPSYFSNNRTTTTSTLNSLVNSKRYGNRSSSANSNGQVQDSSPWIINETYMDFPEFVELFKSFYFHCRRDLKDLFDKFASEINLDQDYTIKDQYKNDSLDVSRHLTGLITRNIVDDITDPSVRRIYDMIAISSIPCYAISTHTRGNYLITKEQFREFLLEHQKEDKTSYEIEQIIYRHEPNRQNRLNKVLSFEGFSRYLLDKENYAFVNEHTKANEQDLDYPLSYYFVASSHNTYLTGHQLRGESSVEMYREVLLSGCRCVELDCWDGDDGYPVIYHGRTFVSKISFKLVVEVINESAFVTSPYPVILSIENRCSLMQQARMAQIFVKVFGDKLITKFMFDSDFAEDPLLPSPNQLKYKILIKNKKINKMQSTSQLSKQKVQLSVNYRNSVYSSPDDNEEDEDSEDDEMIDDFNDDQIASGESQRSNSMTDSPMYNLKKTNTNTTVDHDGDEDIRSYQQRRYSILNTEPRQRLKSSSSIDANQIMKANKTMNVSTKAPPVLVAKELSDIVVYTQAVKFRGLSCSTGIAGTVAGKPIRKVPKRNIQQLVAQPSTTSTSTESSRSIDQVSPSHQIVSLIENKAKKLSKNQPMDMIIHTETQLVRCYPSGFRVDSSNFNPVHLWVYGIQLAATNYQTLDAGQIMNLSMFEQNGCCGYVLKPNVFWDKEHPQYGHFNPSLIERDGPCSELTITIISGQYLTQNVGSTTSVYIEVELLGIPIDSMSRKTKPSVKNSLNPIWQETFVFQLFFAELAFVRFHVYDAGSNHLMSQRVIPLKCLRPGYRHVRLRDVGNIPLELATLFIYSKITDTMLIRNAEQDLSTSNTPHLFRNKILRRAADPPEPVGASRESIRPKHKTFEVRVYGKDGRDEDFRPFAVTQYTTVEELMEMIGKASDFLKSGDNVNDMILTESSKTWKKKSSSNSKTAEVAPRLLEKHERILEVIDRVGRETVILCKKKAPEQGLSLSTLIDKNIQTWENCDRNFLVTIHNVSSIQKHTTFRTPISSTAINVITQLMTKIRINGLPNDYGIVEETGQNVNPSSSRRMTAKRRLLADDENVYEVQRLWNGPTSKFVLVKKNEFVEMNNNNANNKPLTDKFLFRSLARQKSIDHTSQEEEIHSDVQNKQRTGNNLNQNSTVNGNISHNRMSSAATSSVPKTHHNSRKSSLKRIFSTSKS